MTARAIAAVRLRALAPAALRLGGAGVVGAAIGLGARRVEAAEAIADAVEAARTLGELPVWETARRLLAALMHLTPPALPALPAWWPAAALLAVGVALAVAALRLWRAPSPASPARGGHADRAAQVPALAADGLGRLEIARRTGLSRDAVALSLRLQARQV